MSHTPHVIPPPRVGSITLVGAGPGDPELITLAGARALAEADVVIYDRLVNPALLQHAPQAEAIYLGKDQGNAHHVTQELIQRTMVEAAQRGQRVVRLKGGDPYVFGRGGEEVLAAREAGVVCRVIPGVTAALGAGAAAGIPLTHRDVARSVAFVTGCTSDFEHTATDWRALARAVDTIVIYMGVRHLNKIAAALIEGGRAADEPVAAVRHATLPEEAVQIFTLGELAAAQEEPRLAPPAVIVVGAVVRLRNALLGLTKDIAHHGRATI